MMSKTDDDQNSYMWLKCNIYPILISTVETLKRYTTKQRNQNISFKQLTTAPEKNQQKANW